MASYLETLEGQIFSEFGKLLFPLEELADDENVIPFFRELGWELPAQDLFQDGINTVSAAITVLRSTLSRLNDDTTTTDSTDLLKSIGGTLDAITSFEKDLTKASADIKDFIDNSGILKKGELFIRILNYLVVKYLAREHPKALSVLALLGLLKTEKVTPTTKYEPKQPYILRTILWDNFPKLISPTSLAADAYQWGPAFDAPLVLAHLNILLRAFGIAGGKYRQALTNAQALGTAPINALDPMVVPDILYDVSPMDVTDPPDGSDTTSDEGDSDATSEQLPSLDSMTNDEFDVISAMPETSLETLFGVEDLITEDSDQFAGNKSEIRFPIFSGGTWGADYYEFGLSLSAMPKGTGPGSTTSSAPGLALVPYIYGTVKDQLDLTQFLQATIDGLANLKGGVALVLRPKDGLSVKTGLFQAGGGSGQAKVALTLAAKSSDKKPFVIFGLRNETHLQVVSTTFAFYADIKGASKDIGIDLELADFSLNVLPPAGDGFLGKILPADGISPKASLGLSWSRSGGLRFKASGSLSIDLPINLTMFDALRLSGIHIELMAGTDAPGVALEVSSQIQMALGPLQATADRIGAELRLTLPQEGGNLGKANLKAGFKPPTGLAISVNAGTVTGGGYISYDENAGRYSGALQLKFASFALGAWGILDTKFADGSKGYSFLILICAEFKPAIQLGFGFALSGVGGLVGINRSFNQQALISGIKNKAMDHILFPQDPATNAPQIVNDLGQVFPAVDGHFTVGPMVKIVWGTPQLIDGELGILMSFYDKGLQEIIVLGSVNAYFPAKQVPIPGAPPMPPPVVEIHFDVFGDINFEKKTLLIYGALHDSQIEGFTLSGSMGMISNWGDQPDFAVSIGGFNPHYQAPAAMPALQRFTIALCTGDNPKLSLQSYLALTSNTLQLGALAELKVDFGLQLYGLISFDALVTFSPFAFLVDLSGAVSIRDGDTNIATVHLDAHMSGPNPWHIHGDASISVLFWSISFPFDVTFGDDHPKVLPTVDPWAEFQKALTEPKNWSEVPAKGIVAVTTPLSTDLPSVVSPIGGLKFHQRILPLGESLTRYAHSPLADGAQVFQISDFKLNEASSSVTEGDKDYFALGQYKDLNDQQELSAPSFEKRTSGASIQAEDMVMPDFDDKLLGHHSMEYETKVMLISGKLDDDPSMPVPNAGKYQVSMAHFEQMARHGATANSSLKNTVQHKYSLDRSIGLDKNHSDWDNPHKIQLKKPSNF